MRRTATVLALSTALLAPVPAFAQEASPSPSALCPNVSIVASAEDMQGPPNVPVTIEGGSDVQPAKTPDRWTLTRISPGPVEVVGTVENSPTFSFTFTVAETTTFRVEAVGPEGCGPTFADFTRTVTSASPSPSANPCEGQRGSVTLGTPSPRSIVAGETVTYTATLTGPLENYADHTNNSYRWATPSTKAPAEVTSAPAPILDRLEEGETATRTVTLLPTTNTRLLYNFGYRSRCLHADGADSDVINVAPRLTLTAVRNGVRDYTFSGVATTPGLILNLYRVNADGSKVLTSQARADADRTWTIHRKFLGSGRFGFVVLTGRTMANAPGESNTRPTVIH